MNIIRISLVSSLALTLSMPLQAMRRGFLLSPSEKAARISRSERATRTTSRQKKQHASPSEGATAASEQPAPAQQQQQTSGALSS